MRLPQTKKKTDVWMNLVIDMGELMPFFFDGAKFATLQRIDLEAACRLRRCCVFMNFPPNLCR